MSKVKSQKEIANHKKIALGKLEQLIDLMIKNDPMKADKFSYWLEDYSSFIGYENKFNPCTLKRYKRGEVVKAHLGFRIGSEEGGLHYCVVLDKNNNLSSPIVTVIPLTSVKDPSHLNHLRKGEIYIGDALYNTLSKKVNDALSNIEEETSTLILRRSNSETVEKDDFIKVLQQLDAVSNMQNELNGMKTGSIALIGQITTISKIRIYTPKNKHEPLSNVRLSSETLDLIDKEIINLFIGKNNR